MLIGSAIAGDKYPLTMTAVLTPGTITNGYGHATYHSGNYDCTKGDEHNAPICHTPEEWAELDRIGGTPDTVLFTLADGSKVGVQSVTVNKRSGYIECIPTAQVIFCNLYFELLARKESATPAQFHYRLKGKPQKGGFQRIEVDPKSCKTDRLGVNLCKEVLLNPRGDGYYVEASK